MIDPEKVSNVQRTSNKRDREGQICHCKLPSYTITVISLTFLYLVLSLVAKMHAACSHSPHNVLVRFMGTPGLGEDPNQIRALDFKGLGQKFRLGAAIKSCL